MEEEQIHKERLAFINSLIFENAGGFRYTQDCPILANVWMEFALNPFKQQELILTLKHGCKAGEAVSSLREMLINLRKKRDPENTREPARIAYIPGQVAIKLYFDELMRVILPLTPWWHDIYKRLTHLQHTHPEATPAEWRPFPQPREDIVRDLSDALISMHSEIFRLFPDVDNDYKKLEKKENIKRKDYINAIPSEICWVVRIAGVIGESLRNKTRLLEESESDGTKLRNHLALIKGDEITTSGELKQTLTNKNFFENEKETRLAIVKHFTGLYDSWSENDEYPEEGFVAKVTKNRRVHLAGDQSRMTIKADAAKRLFDISCNELTWAVIDSGIDREHPAFKLTTEEHYKDVKQKLKRQGEDHNRVPLEALDSRVTKVLDFTRFRELLSYDVGGRVKSPKAKIVELYDELQKRLEESDENSKDIQQKLRAFKSIERTEPGVLGILLESYNPKQLADFLEKYSMRDLKQLRLRILGGKEINWEDLEPLIVDETPATPVNDHGTHVAGILAADWIDEDFEDKPLSERPRIMRGVCPDINLIDVRVFRQDGLTDEFELLAAIQFLRWMNSQAGTMQVHGANISLSLIHEVRRFACGQTPVCIECNEAVSAGMVIVAAAGNRGFEMSEVDVVKASDSYKSVSITDPGNAEKVITVGATHYKRPHEYGVSYFSSRGPTGDGRMKPDLVAPGEKVFGPTINKRGENKDGTSMAAPHVSGAAAMLMARNSELIAQPEVIKSILCETATDLEREKYFQGNGLVDILRALQSR